jgi:hypothetical protein
MTTGILPWAPRLDRQKVFASFFQKRRVFFFFEKKKQKTGVRLGVTQLS